MRRLALILTLLAAAAAAPAPAETLRLTTTDFATRDIDVTAMDTDALTIAAGDQIPAGEVLRLANPDSQPRPATGWVAQGVGGERLVGPLVGLDDDDALIVRIGRFGNVSLPLDRLAVLRRADADPPEAPADRTADVVLLANGDRVRGLVAGLTADAVTVQPDGGGAALELPLDGVAAVFPAALGRGEPEPGWQVSMADGAIVPVDAAGFDSGRWLFDHGQRQASVPPDEVLAVEQVNGPVLFLSALRPTEASQTPYLTAAAPARFDADVAGDPLPGGVRGIGVHSRSELTFDVPAGYEMFRTGYAVANNAARADVDLSIRLDGEVAWQKQGVTAATPEEVVELPLNGAKTLTLVVDYGRNLDAQDRLNWLQPALVR